MVGPTSSWVNNPNKRSGFDAQKACLMSDADVAGEKHVTPKYLDSVLTHGKSSEGGIK